MSLATPTVNGLARTDLMRADIVDNYDIDATAGGLWTDTTHYKVTVPAGYSYFVFGGVIGRSAAQTAITDIYNAAGAIILRLGSLASATTVLNYPDSAAGNLMLPVKVKAGDYIQTTYGGAQGAAAWETCYVLKVKD